jgi:hypothetical protein
MHLLTAAWSFSGPFHSELGWFACLGLVIFFIGMMLGVRIANAAWKLRSNDDGFGRTAHYCEGKMYYVIPEAEFVQGYVQVPGDWQADTAKYVRGAMRDAGVIADRVARDEAAEISREFDAKLEAAKREQVRDASADALKLSDEEGRRLAGG